MIKWMKKGISLGLCGLILVYCVGLWQEHGYLEDHLLRLHVIANSDSAADQSVKLQVRDAVAECLGTDLSEFSDLESAMDYVRSRLPELEAAANGVLKTAGTGMTAVVQLVREAFPRRDYENFSLPAGQYEALRIIIGEGQGQNWWCVVFPTLCAPREDFAAAAEAAGMPETLTETLEQPGPRFFLLDLLGRAKNWISGRP